MRGTRAKELKDIGVGEGDGRSAYRRRKRLYMELKRGHGVSPPVSRPSQPGPPRRYRRLLKRRSNAR